MLYETVVALRQIPINASTWTDIAGSQYIPIACNLIIVYNSTGVTIYYRSDPANANSQITIAAGLNFEIGMGDRQIRGPRRFQRDPNIAVGALLSASGNVSPIIECIY